MSVGLAQSKSEVDARAGDIARRFQQTFRDVGTLKSYLDRTADADLVALGYTDPEVATLRSAADDMWTLTTIFTGSATQTAAYDFRQFLSALWGVGAF
jgi:hypothetical protein